MHENELPLPPVALERADAVEVLRVWAAPDETQQVVLKPAWPDPGVWGLILVDVARHAANAYQEQGVPREQALTRIIELFRAEWEGPTGDAMRSRTQ
jgi:hypothetical protein